MLLESLRSFLLPASIEHELLLLLRTARYVLLAFGALLLLWAALVLGHDVLLLLRLVDGEGRSPFTALPSALPSSLDVVRIVLLGVVSFFLPRAMYVALATYYPGLFSYFDRAPGAVVAQSQPQQQQQQQLTASTTDTLRSIAASRRHHDPFASPAALFKYYSTIAGDAATWARRLGTEYDALFAVLRNSLAELDADESVVNVFLLGGKGVGKTRLVAALVGESVAPSRVGNVEVFEITLDRRKLRLFEFSIVDTTVTATDFHNTFYRVNVIPDAIVHVTRATALSRLDAESLYITAFLDAYQSRILIELNPAALVVITAADEIYPSDIKAPADYDDEKEGNIAAARAHAMSKRTSYEVQDYIPVSSLHYSSAKEPRDYRYNISILSAQLASLKRKKLIKSHVFFAQALTRVFGNIARRMLAAESSAAATLYQRLEVQLYLVSTISLKLSRSDVGTDDFYAFCQVVGIRGASDHVLKMLVNDHLSTLELDRVVKMFQPLAAVRFDELTMKLGWAALKWFCVGTPAAREQVRLMF